MVRRTIAKAHFNWYGQCRQREPIQVRLAIHPYASGAGTYTIGSNNGTPPPRSGDGIGAFGNNNALPTASTTGIRVVGNSNTVNSSELDGDGQTLPSETGLDGAVVDG